MIARELDLDLPEIYKDPVWKKSGGDGNFVISSSCVGFTNSLGCCSAMCQNGYAQIYCFSDHGYIF
jgi:carnitine O-octanoyltransferase